jgi:hypothetical protein
MDKLICERQRRGSRNLSKKTGARLSVKVDYDDDYDSGPTFLPNGRRRMYGWKAKELNENLSPLYRYLDSSAGRPWDEVYSEIRTNIDTRSAIGLHVMQHLYQHVEREVVVTDGVPYRCSYGWVREVDGLYIHPDTGMLEHHTSSTAWRKRDNRKTADPDRLHWYGNTFLIREKRMKSVCRCNQPKWDERPRWEKYHQPAPLICQHGNPLTVFYVWTVVEYEYRHPEDVYKVHTYENSDEWTRRRFNLVEPGMRHVIRYRDVPDKMAEPIVVRRKTANRKEMKIIARMLETASGK